MKPRRPWGLRTAKMWPPSFAFGLPSGVMSYADQKEASASLAANCQAVTTFVGSWEARRSGVTRKSERRLAVPGGRELRNRRHVREPPGGPSGVVSCANQEASPSLGAANCETVATFVSPWGVQRSGVIRRSE